MVEAVLAASTVKVSNCQIEEWGTRGNQGGEAEAGAREAEGPWARTQLFPPLPQQGAGAVGPHEAMGGQGAQGGLRSGPLSPSPAAAVSLSPPAGGAAFGGVGNLVALVMGALPPPGAHQAVLPISEPTQGSIPMDHPPVWPSRITP